MLSELREREMDGEEDFAKKKIWGVGSSRGVKGTDSLNVSKWQISWKG